MSAIWKIPSDIEITVRTMKGIHIFKKDFSNQTSLCIPWGSQVCPFPSLVKKMGAYLEERQKYRRPFLSYLTPTLIDPSHHHLWGCKFPWERKPRIQGRRSRKVNHQASRKQYKVRQLEEPFLLSKAAMPTFTLAVSHQQQTLLPPPQCKPLSSHQTAQHLSTCTNCAQSKSIQSNIQIMAKVPYTPVPFSSPVHSDCCLRGGLGWHQAEGERGNKTKSSKNNRGKIAEERRKKMEEENGQLCLPDPVNTKPGSPLTDPLVPAPEEKERNKRWER